MARTATPRRILVIDVGGTHVKFRVGASGRTGKFVSGPRMTPAKMTHGLLAALHGARFDAIAMGYPGVVFHGRIAAEPHNLAPGWVGFDFAQALGKPVRIVNDAAMQALGSYAGGRMLFLGLGTGLGVSLILDGVIEPTEIGHVPYKHGRTYEEYLGERGRRKHGSKRWRKDVAEVVEHLRTALEVDYVVIGGGNAKRLKQLPVGARLGDNRNAFLGGLRLWQPDALVRAHRRGTSS